MYPGHRGMDDQLEALGFFFVSIDEVRGHDAGCPKLAAGFVLE